MLAERLPTEAQDENTMMIAYKTFRLEFMSSESHPLMVICVLCAVRLTAPSISSISLGA